MAIQQLASFILTGHKDSWNGGKEFKRIVEKISGENVI